ncbi:hypothetical protein SAMN05216262_1226 [Colwellia chukchiensis]|uniref:Transposase, Mutator family n=1 Tax=Colwellia chukchiensis TaxID=641665 RepID=A0A1H7SZX9_9GAMM|nr:hypothetical protein SAMN05216262_1226 [Colwellia chukchiensis]
MTQSFDFNKALAELQSGKGLTGEDGVLTPLIKQLTEAALKAVFEFNHKSIQGRFPISYWHRPFF